MGGWLLVCNLCTCSKGSRGGPCQTRTLGPASLPIPHLSSLMHSFLLPMQAVAAGSEVVSSMCIQMEQWAFGPGGVAPRKRKDQCVLPPEVGVEGAVG